MRSKWIKKIFPLFALLLLAPWPLAFARDYNNETVNQDAVQIEAAEASVQPTWTAFGKAIGGLTPGDLFYIDASNNAADIPVTLYITNAQELIRCYRNLILKVGIYVESDTGEWEIVPTDTFITMRNAQVNFTLPGLAKYKVTIDSGSFYCTTNTDGGSLSPQFYLAVD